MFRQLLFVAAVVAVAHAAAWDNNNNPTAFAPDFVYTLPQLPATFNLSTTPWSDTYWPSYMGGIANRWQDANDNTPGFNYTLYTLAQLKAGAIDLNILSPAEKFDIYRSRYDYPLVHSEWTRTSPNDATWEGICHGWSPAAINYNQPNQVTLNNTDGLAIPFGSSDVKALLSYFLAVYAQDQEQALFVATRCETDLNVNPAAGDQPECWDINPGAFHVVMTNMLGKRGTGIVGDIDRGIQVWNQPLSGYQATLGQTRAPSSGAATGTASEQQVSFTLYYTKEMAPSVTSHGALTYSEQYSYYLELDSNSNILGGSWDTSDYARTDFLWSEPAPAFYGDFQALATIYQAASPSGPTPAPTSAHRMGRSVPHTVNELYRAKHTSGLAALRSYTDKTRRSWLVRSPAPTKAVKVQFDFLDTRRNVDFVRVYEVTKANTLGALVGVYHGSALPADLIVRGDAVLVSFGVNRMASRSPVPSKHGKGFSLRVQPVA